jgi:hypothetical protein
VELQEPSGQGPARNRGVALAERPVVAFLDDDIRPVPEWLAAHMEAQAGTGFAGAVIGPYPPRPPAAGTGWWDQHVVAWWNDHFRRLAEPGHRWTFQDVVGGNLSVRRDVFERVGRFDERIPGRREDFELGIRLLASAVPLRFASRAFGWHDVDTSFETALRHRRYEGTWDVELARMHPGTAAQLELARLTPADLRAGRSLGRVDVHLARTGMAAAERLRARPQWRRLAYGLLWRAYARSVDEALTHPDELAHLTPVDRAPASR